MIWAGIAHSVPSKRAIELRTCAQSDEAALRLEATETGTSISGVGVLEICTPALGAESRSKRNFGMPFLSSTDANLASLQGDLKRVLAGLANTKATRELNF